MADQELMDSAGRYLGKIQELSGGVLEGRDASGRLKGRYYPKSNETHDASGKLVGKGNTLSKLIIDSMK
jgi:hypothetical protein